jgi:hypothetical protein
MTRKILKKAFGKVFTRHLSSVLYSDTEEIYSAVSEFVHYDISVDETRLTSSEGDITDDVTSRALPTQNIMRLFGEAHCIQLQLAKTSFGIVGNFRYFLVTGLASVAVRLHGTAFFLRT